MADRVAVFELVRHSLPNGPSKSVTRGLVRIYGSLRHSQDRKMSGTKWQFLTMCPATLLIDLQLGYQAVRRFRGGKQTTEVAAGSLARPSIEHVEFARPAGIQLPAVRSRVLTRRASEGLY